MKTAVAGVLTVAAVAIAFYMGSCSRNDEIAQMATRLATSEQTVEISKGLYAERTHEIEDLKDLISVVGAENTTLQEQIDLSQAEILTLNQLVAKWKKAYEGALIVTQTEDPPVVISDPPRQRVTFTKDFGYIGVSGYTLTNPPEGYVKVEQLRPLKLTVAVTKNRDSTWSSYVTSSEENVGIDLAITGVDLSILKPRWFQRIWIDVGANFVGGQSVSVGASYRMDRWSLGLACSAGDLGGCGLTAGFRLFK